MIYILLALLSGAVLPVQASINAALRTHLGHPVWAALVSFLVGTSALALWAFATRLPLPAQGFGGIDAWKWTGGALGAVFVTLAVIVTPRLGPATAIALIIFGQLAASLILDHTGWLGVAQHSVNAPRVLGALLMLLGVWLIQKY